MKTREEFINFLEEHNAFTDESKMNLTSGINRYIKNRPEILKEFQSFTNCDSTNISELIYRVVNPAEENICKICGAPTKFGAYYSGYKKACGSKCAHLLSFEKGTQTKIEKYGIPYFDTSKVKKSKLEKYGSEGYVNVEKRRRTNMRKYGTPWANNVEKGKQTCLQKYGVDNVAKLESSKVKQRATTLKHYGVEYVMQSPEVIQKYKDNCLAKTGKEWYTQTQETQDLKRERLEKELRDFEEKNNCTERCKLLETYKTSWLKLNLPYIRHKRFLFIDNNYIPQIKQCSENSKNNISLEETEVLNYCRELLPREKIIHGSWDLIKSKEGNALEIDIYIPSKKVAIEFNGIYWHSLKDKNYHLQKTEECEKLGIRLIHIWEDLWNSKKDLYKDLIARSLGNYQKIIPTQNCKIKEIPKKEYISFLENNCLLFKEEASMRLGIVYNEEIVAVMGLSKNRKNKEGYELNCFCEKKGIKIERGLYFLLKYLNLEKIECFLDRSFFNEKTYIEEGFKRMPCSEPSFFYHNTKKEFSRLRSFEIKKSKLFENKGDYDNNISEEDNMLNKGYLKIYDCGKINLIYKPS